MDIPENFFGVGGEEDITIQTVTWPDVELPLPRNITEGEARGNVILTAKPDFEVSPTAPEREEPFTFAPEVRATAFPAVENRTGEATWPWAFPRESTPGVGAPTAFTSEDLVVQVTLAPGVTEVPGQPRLPGGKCPPLKGLHPGPGERAWSGVFCVQCRKCSLSRVRLFATPRTGPSRLLCPWNSSGKDPGLSWVAISLLRGIFPTQGIEPASLVLAGRFFTTEATWVEVLLYFQLHLRCKTSLPPLRLSSPHL